MQFRINNLKISDKELLESMKPYSNEFTEIGKINGKSIYSSELSIGKTFEHTLGYMYIQSFSSMLPAIFLDPKPGELVLDMCSAPGSKTTLLSDLMMNKGIIVANEISLERIKQLSYNLDRIGSLNTVVLNENGFRLSNFIRNKFDKILLDPPCSALGSVQESTSQRHKKNLSRLDNLTEIQYKLFVSALKMLKKDGEIIYSTCTTTIEENEQIIEKILKSYPVSLLDLSFSNWENNNGYSFGINNNLPGTIRLDEDGFFSEKFFVAKLKLNEELDKKSDPINNMIGSSVNSKEVLKILEGLSRNYGIDINYWNDFEYSLSGSYLYFRRKGDLLLESINPHRFGMKLASYDNKSDWRLSTNSSQILKDNITRNFIELNDKEVLVRYYNGNNIYMAAEDTNFAIIRYKGMIIGTGKIKNNYLISQFPKARRMTMIDFSVFN